MSSLGEGKSDGKATGVARGTGVLGGPGSVGGRGRIASGQRIHTVWPAVEADWAAPMGALAAASRTVR
jgi:hypothetical protein